MYWKSNSELIQNWNPQSVLPRWYLWIHAQMLLNYEDVKTTRNISIMNPASSNTKITITKF